MRWLMAITTAMTVATGVQAQGLVTALEDEMIEWLRDAPDKTLAAVAEVILGWGRDGSIDADGIEQMIAVRRASVRATALRRLQVADLDNDGAITRREAGILMPTLSASLRARLVMSQRQADADGDGTVTGAELRAWGEAIARNAIRDGDAEDLRRLMLMDRDGDGWLTLDEAAQVIALARLEGEES